MAMSVAPSVSADVTLDGPVTVTFYSGDTYFESGDVISGNPRNVGVKCKDGFIFDKVWVNGNVVYDYDTAEQIKDIYSWWREDHEETITRLTASTIKLSDVQTESITIKSSASYWYVDWAMTFSKDGYSHNVEEGTVEVKYIPGRDRLRIDYTWYIGYYCITHNGNLINLWPAMPDDDILIDVNDGDEIEFVSPVPDKMCHVTISSPENETTFLKCARYGVHNPQRGDWDYYEVENPLSFDAPAGSVLTWEWNTEFEYTNEIWLNGVKIDYDLSYNNKFLVIPVDRDNVTISMQAKRWKEIEMQVDIDDASRIVLIAAPGWDNEKRYSIHDGLQTIQVPVNGGLVFYPKGNSVIESISVDGKVQEKSSSPYHDVLDYDTFDNFVSGKETGTIYVTTAERERNFPCKVYVRDCNGTAKLWASEYIEPYYFDIKDGENMLMMCAADLEKLMVSFNQDADSPRGTVQSLLSVYERDHNLYELTNPYPKQTASVINIYGAGGPHYHDVTVQSEFDRKQYELKRDYNYLLNSTFNSLPEGSLFHVNMLGDEGAEVHVNGKKLNSESPMSHVFTVMEPSTVEIKKVTTGIEDVAADTDSQPVYYNLQGVRVDNPGPGLYIVVRGGEAKREVIR